MSLWMRTLPILTNLLKIIFNIFNIQRQFKKKKTDLTESKFLPLCFTSILRFRRGIILQRERERGTKHRVTMIHQEARRNAEGGNKETNESGRKRGGTAVENQR